MGQLRIHKGLSYFTVLCPSTLGLHTPFQNSWTPLVIGWLNYFVHKDCITARCKAKCTFYEPRGYRHIRRSRTQATVAWAWSRYLALLTSTRSLHGPSCRQSGRIWLRVTLSTQQDSEYVHGVRNFRYVSSVRPVTGCGQKEGCPLATTFRPTQGSAQLPHPVVKICSGLPLTSVSDSHK
jgi:hypothetical protein